MLNIVFILSVFLSAAFTVGEAKTKPANLAQDFLLMKTLNKYSKSVAVKIEFTKTDFKKTLSSTQKTKGQFFYSSGKMNILTEGDKKTEVIFNGSQLWLIEHPDLDFDPKAGRKITEVSDGKPALVQQIIGLFSKPATFLKKFKKISEKQSGDTLTVQFESKDKTIQSFNVDFNQKSQLIEALGFTDDVQTETRIIFEKTIFLKSIKNSIFQMSHKKNDEVI